jgi:hypothetical protein
VAIPFHVAHIDVRVTTLRPAEFIVVETLCDGSIKRVYDDSSRR